MHHVDILFMATFWTFATAGAWYQLGSWAQRPELNYFAQSILTQACSILLLSVLDARQRSES
jgi:hypothetical protein